MAYVVSLKQFEGPLDLLLHLITRAKVDIKDIFVSEITEQYLASLDGIDELDMDSASEFLQMAATLVEIKSRALLPKPPEPEDPEEESPEEALIRQLEEYKKFKGLKKENLRDNMTNEELVLNMLAELSTTSITKSKNPQTLEDNMKCAADGGDVARVAREQLEVKTGRNVVSPLSAKRFFEEQRPNKEIEDGEENER